MNKSLVIAIMQTSLF